MLDNLALVENINEYVSPVVDLDSKPKIDQKTLDDYYAFFTGKEIDMLPYVYAESSDVYNNLVHAPEYYLFRDEVNTITSNKEILKKHLIDVTDIIEIGPGCDYTVKNKTIPILNCAANLKRYHAIDYSESYLKEACRSVKKRKNNIEVLSIRADLMNDKINIDSKLEGKRCVLFLGSTLGNFTEKQQQYAVDQIAGIIDTNDLLIFGVDTNSNKEDILKSYNYENISSYNFIISMLKFFCKIDSEFEQHIKFFDIKSEWNENHNSVKIFAQLNQNVIINSKKLGILGLKKDDILKIGTSKKFNVKMISNLLKNKFEIVDHVSFSNKMRIFVCSKI